MFRLSFVIFCLINAVCVEAMCSDSSHCHNCPDIMTPVCFLRQCRCFGSKIPNECSSPSDCQGVCLPETLPVCPDGRCHCLLGI